MFKVIHGECIEVMDSMEDNSIPSIVDDPPYALGFMGKDWDTFSPKQYQEFMFKVGKAKLRVLMPGGYNLSFSGTRTYHRMVCGLEDAGFTIKDMIMWCYGSGFPKSLDISKAIDVSLGIKYPHGELISKNIAMSGGNYSRDNKMEVQTPEAKQWNGWGTGLKPAFEPVVVAQKPYEKTYAENVLKYGVGGINIDGCRIQYQAKGEDPRVYNEGIINIAREASKYTVSFPPLPMKYAKPKGRYPANLLLTHHPECRLIGSKKVGSGKLTLSKDVNRTAIDEFFKGKNPNKTLTPSNRGVENIEAYNCHPECPVRLLDEQSGETKSSDAIRRNKPEKGNVQFTSAPNGIRIGYGHSDKGGASRFFYCGKAYKTERNAGCYDLFWEKIGDDFKRINEEQYNLLPEKKRAKYNPIATLKPINVMRYLVRLVCPKGGTVLDPFTGSGGTGIACILEGMNSILIEKRKAFAKVVIPKRLKFWKDPNNWKTLKDHNILPKVRALKNKKTNRTLSAFF